MFKKVLLATALTALPLVAQASDLPSKKAPAVAPVAHAVDNWTGGYIGVIGGYGWSQADFSLGGVDPSISSDGWLVGGQIGYDWLVANNLVLGVVADISWSDINGRLNVETNGDTTHTSYAHSNIDWFGTVRARAGYAADNLLIYGTGGLAYAGTKSDISYFNSSTDTLRTADKDVMGWTVGGGLEYKIAKNASFGVEYLYMDFGKNTYDFSSGQTDGFSVPASTTVDVVRASLNYRF